MKKLNATHRLGGQFKNSNNNLALFYNSELWIWHSDSVRFSWGNLTFVTNPKVKMDNFHSTNFEVCPQSGRKKTLLLRHKNDGFGAKLGVLWQPLRPAAAAAAIENAKKPQ